VTLLEVLTAMFIMAIGMLALLTLFPLGAINMAQALRDDRAASSAHSGANFAAALNLRQDANIAQWYTQSPLGVALAGTYTGPGYPVFVDAYGTGAVPTSATNANGDLQDINGNPIIKRVSPSYIINPAAWDPPQAVTWAGNTGVQDRWFCLLDDITFTPAAVPDPPGGAVDRAGKFTWAYLLQPVSATNTNTVNMFVVVYSGRAIGALTAETAVSCAGLSGNTSISIISSANVASPTDVEIPRRGGWILDTTPNANGVPAGNFYQVINVDPTGTAIDVQPALTTNISSFVIFNDVHFVAAKGTNLYP
jgi:hypothetical protein